MGSIPIRVALLQQKSVGAPTILEKVAGASLLGVTGSHGWLKPNRTEFDSLGRHVGSILGINLGRLRVSN